MLIIYCGEDSARSRLEYQNLLADYKKKGYVSESIKASEMKNVLLQGSEVHTLFDQQLIYTTDNLNKQLGRKGQDKTIDLLAEIAKDEKQIIIDWEDGSSQRELKIATLATKIKEFKADKNIFQLLDAFLPTKRKAFLDLFASLTSPQNEMFIYIMLIRHVRKLILAQEGVFPARVLPWQRGKLEQQAKAWKQEDLVNFYQKLLHLEILLKTGKNPYTLSESIDILSCYYLK